MESDTGTFVLGILMGVAALVLLGPPLVILIYRQFRHRRGRWFRRSVRRSRR